MSPAELEAYLHENIPLTAALGATVLAAGTDSVALSAPYAPNRNHRGTVFGGSLVTLAITAGWAIVFLGLRQERIDARIVIQRSAMEYLAPAESFFDAVAEGPDPVAWSRFCAAIVRKGRGRISLTVNVTSAGRTVATLSADFVGLRQDTQTPESRGSP